jgi:drug/metabolite transporter (DMT)-like permease
LPAAAILWPIGSLLAIAFGVWLALHDSQYSLGDGWIIAAIVLWAVGGAIGGRLGTGYREMTSGGGPDPAALAMNLALIITLLVILIDMIYKPGAS